MTTNQDSDFQELTYERRVEMNDFMRAESRSGRPEIAAPYRKALLEGYYLAPPSTSPDTTSEILAPPTSGSGSGKGPWRDYAKAVSPDTPEEVINAMSAAEVQQMLYAQGVLVEVDAKPYDDETTAENE